MMTRKILCYGMQQSAQYSLKTGCWFRDKGASQAVILMTGENMCTQRYR